MIYLDNCGAGERAITNIFKHIDIVAADFSRYPRFYFIQTYDADIAKESIFLSCNFERYFAFGVYSENSWWIQFQHEVLRG